MDGTFADNPDELGHEKWWWGVRALALVALTLSVYLAWASWQATPVAGCGSGTNLDCNEVLSSRWSTWLGVPVSLFGILTYATILGCSWPASRRRGGLAWMVVLGLSIAAVGSALWFIAVQVVDIGSYCPYCMTVHACGLAILALLAWDARRQTDAVQDYGQMRALLGVETDAGAIPESPSQEPLSQRHFLVPTLAAALGLSALIGGQWLMPAETLSIEMVIAEPAEDTTEGDANAAEPTEAQTSTPTEDRQPDDSDVAEETEATFFGEGEDQAFELKPATPEDPSESPSNPSSQTEGDSSPQHQIPGLQNKVDLSVEPLIGNPKAKHLFVEFMDYTCPQCRKLHPFLREAVERSNGQLAIVVRHVPLNLPCNQYVPTRLKNHDNACEFAYLAVKIWKRAPEHFEAFHDWMLASDKPPSIRAARRHAMDLVGIEVLTDESKVPAIRRRIADHCTTVHQLKSGVPLLFTQFGTIRGLPRSSEHWFTLLEEKLEITFSESLAP